MTDQPWVDRNPGWHKLMPSGNWSCIQPGKPNARWYILRERNGPTPYHGYLNGHKEIAERSLALCMTAIETRWGNEKEIKDAEG